MDMPDYTTIRRPSLRMLGLALLSMLLVACTTTQVPNGPASLPDKRAVYKDTVEYYTSNYLLSPGDEVEITYHFSVFKQDEYLIDVGDQIRIEFYYYPQLDRTLNVRPDGKVTLPYKGDIVAVGLTPPDLAKQISARFADLLNNPRATVTLVRYGESIRELKEAIKTAQRGQSRLALVQPDGNIAIPMLPPLMAGGKTIGEVQRMVNEAYTPILKGMYTSVTLREARGNRFYIYGEVANPGYYQLNGPTTVSQAIGMAGGLRDSAQHGSTLLITRNEKKQAVGRIVDVEEILSTGNIGKDIMVRQADVVFVPKTTLGRAAIIGNMIRNMIPVDLSFAYTLNENVDILKKP